MNVAPSAPQSAPNRRESVRVLLGEVAAAKGRIADASLSELQTIRDALARVSRDASHMADILADRERRSVRTPTRSLALLFRELALAYDALDTANAAYGWRSVDTWVPKAAAPGA